MNSMTKTYLKNMAGSSDADIERMNKKFDALMDTAKKLFSDEEFNTLVDSLKDVQDPQEKIEKVSRKIAEY